MPAVWSGPSRVTEVVVAEITERNKDTDWWTLDKRYECNDGNCWRGWATDEGHGPEVVFRGLLVDGFKSPQHLIDAIRQFAKIRQCQWARDMLKPHVAEKLGIVV
jgi:hypothetical protein